MNNVYFQRRIYNVFELLKEKLFDKILKFEIIFDVHGFTKIYKIGYIVFFFS